MQTQQTGRVVVGISNTLAGYQALRYAVARARESGARLVAVRAFLCTSHTAQWRHVLADAAAEYVAEVFTEALGGRPRDLTVDIVIRADEPARALTRIADRADDLLVIGGSGRRVPGHVRAKVARRCSREAGCPVVMVPPPAMSRRRVPRLARDVVRTADTLLASPDGQPAMRPPETNRGAS